MAVEAVADTAKTAEIVALAEEAVFLEPLEQTLEALGFRGRGTPEVPVVLITVQIMMWLVVAVVLVALVMITTLAVEQTAAMAA